MTYGHTVLLGIVQGITEFLPVSSDGHLTVFQAALGEGSLALDVALHLGTLFSMVFFFRRNIQTLFTALLRPQTPGAPQERRQALLILTATLPTGIVGLGLKHTVESLTASWTAAGVGFLVTASLLLWGERRGKNPAERLAFSAAPLWHAVGIGLAQGLAVWPGLSRSASTIAVALALRWSWEDAGRFSFLAALPAIAGATLLTARDMNAIPLGPTLVGIVVSFIVGTLSLSLLMRFLAARRLWPFAFYCLGLGLFALYKGGV